MAEWEGEGWDVPQRVPLIAAAALLLTLSLLLVAAGWLYRREIAPLRRVPPQTFPAPGIETFVHDGALDPHRPRPQPTRDAALVAAKRAVARDGWPQ